MTSPLTPLERAVFYRCLLEHVEEEVKPRIEASLLGVPTIIEP